MRRVRCPITGRAWRRPGTGPLEGRQRRQADRRRRVVERRPEQRVVARAIGEAPVGLHEIGPVAIREIPRRAQQRLDRPRGLLAPQQLGRVGLEHPIERADQRLDVVHVVEHGRRHPEVVRRHGNRDTGRAEAV